MIISNCVRRGCGELWQDIDWASKETPSSSSRNQTARLIVLYVHLMFSSVTLPSLVSPERGIVPIIICEQAGVTSTDRTAVSVHVPGAPRASACLSNQ
jgi:hypothetical protein